jgi:hypothetical protein
LGNNLWGFEDLTGGGDRDYNDLIVKLNIVWHTPRHKWRGFFQSHPLEFLALRVRLNQIPCDTQPRGNLSPDVYPISEDCFRMPYDTV